MILILIMIHHPREKYSLSIYRTDGCSNCLNCITPVYFIIIIIIIIIIDFKEKTHTKYKRINRFELGIFFLSRCDTNRK
jgi:hypothetical protein